jgi:hypothetical protein
MKDAIEAFSTPNSIIHILKQVNINVISSIRALSKEHIRVSSSCVILFYSVYLLPVSMWKRKLMTLAYFCEPMFVVALNKFYIKYMTCFRAHWYSLSKISLRTRYDLNRQYY